MAARTPAWENKLNPCPANLQALVLRPERTQKRRFWVSVLATKSFRKETSNTGWLHQFLNRMNGHGHAQRPSDAKTRSPQ